MTDSGVTESIIESAALAWLEASGWQVAHGLPTSRRARRRPSGATIAKWR